MKTKISLAFLFLFIIISCNHRDKVPPAIDANLLSEKFRPQDDFYNFVNSEWIENNPIPDDKTRWGVTGVLRENTAKDLLSILNASASDRNLKADSDEAKAVYEALTGIPAAVIFQEHGFLAMPPSSKTVLTE